MFLLPSGAVLGFSTRGYWRDIAQHRGGRGFPCCGVRFSCSFPSGGVTATRGQRPIGITPLQVAVVIQQPACCGPVHSVSVTVKGRRVTGN